MHLGFSFTVIRRARWSCEPVALAAFPTGCDSSSAFSRQVLPVHESKAGPSIKIAGYMETAAYKQLNTSKLNKLQDYKV